LFPFFSATSGRPTKELYTVIGVLLFQQAFDLTDQETIEQISFNIQWHYALNIYGQSCFFKLNICSELSVATK